MNVGDTYDDEHGTWRVLSVTNAGRVRSAALMPGTETQAFENGRKTPTPEPPTTLRERLTGVTTIAGMRDALLEHFEG